MSEPQEWTNTLTATSEQAEPVTLAGMAKLFESLKPPREYLVDLYGYCFRFTVTQPIGRYPFGALILQQVAYDKTKAATEEEVWRMMPVYLVDHAEARRVVSECLKQRQRGMQVSG